MGRRGFEMACSTGNPQKLPSATDGSAPDSFQVGDRVVVRRLVPLPGRVNYSDVIGIVVSNSVSDITLRRDAAGYPDADLVTIPLDTIHTAKKIPPRPARPVVQ